MSTVAEAWGVEPQFALALLHPPDPSLRRDFLGKVLLFPTRLDHSRFIPKKIDFQYDYFLVGVPVGLRGNLGSVLSIDTDGVPEEENCGLLKRCWFNVDQKYYLEPGLHPQGLEGKLHALLRSKGKDLTKWPYAYLVSTPRFLWSTRNIVSWWFLYSSEKELDALVFEVNNSFGERKIVLMEFKSRTGKFQPKDAQQHSIDALPVRFLYSSSQYREYQSKWEKDIFISPFEKVDGYFTTRVRDPCLAGLDEKNAFHSVVTLFNREKEVKIKGTVSSRGKPLDPLVASGPAFAWFLLRWAYISTLSIFRIHFQALRAYMTGTLTFYRRPEVKNTNICREATEIERVFERYFRLFLVHIALHSSQSVRLKYWPSKSAYFSPEAFQSCVEDKQQSLDLEVRSPALYTNVLQYADASTGLALEAKSNPLPADKESCNLQISDIGLLQQMLNQERRFEQRSARGIGGRIRHSALNLSIMILRGTTSSFMDQFVYANLTGAMQHQYQVKQLQYWLRRRFSIMGSPLMLSAYKISGQVTLMRAILAWCCQNPFVRANVDDGALVGYTGGLLLLYALWVLRRYI
ncbi:uncharacterized protein BDW70DRAFT_165180 [Aspergillus foveolatus]|uniref:uncharacterized protein n=1 Tax=Aspergillus foveolatus TaxID=210207 RepID=UPI003CCDABB1